LKESENRHRTVQAETAGAPHPLGRDAPVFLLNFGGFFFFLPGADGMAADAKSVNSSFIYCIIYKEGL